MAFRGKHCSSIQDTLPSNTKFNFPRWSLTAEADCAHKWSITVAQTVGKQTELVPQTRHRKTIILRHVLTIVSDQWNCCLRWRQMLADKQVVNKHHMIQDWRGYGFAMWNTPHRQISLSFRHFSCNIPDYGMLKCCLRLSVSHAVLLAANLHIFVNFSILILLAVRPDGTTFRLHLCLSFWLHFILTTNLSSDISANSKHKCNTDLVADSLP